MMNLTGKFINSFKMIPAIRKMSSSVPEVIISKINNCGVITLNRPKSLNALNLRMVRMIYPKLKEWAHDSEISHVVIEGIGDRAFCAGGDVLSIINLAAAKDSHAVDFFREEYKLNYLISTFPKPFVALLDGITMGGGAGLSVHGRFRVATERTLFAMPETSIGLFPDVGGGYFLPRLPHPGLGLYLALTGVRLKGSDVLWCGIATSYTPSIHIERLKTQLCNLQSKDPKQTQNEVEQILLDHHSSVGFVEPNISKYMDKIQRFFHLPNIPTDQDGVTWIFDQLSKHSSTQDDWASMTLKTLKTMSPLSLKITLKQLTEGLKMDLKKVLEMEFKLAQNCLYSGDFPEGVRAVLLDKDKNPKWNPDSISKITKKEVQHFFDHLPIGPEWDYIN